MQIKVLWINSRTLDDTVPGRPQGLALHTESKDAGGRDGLWASKSQHKVF